MKKNVTLTLDIDVITEVKKKNINLSEVVNSFLREYIGSKEQEKSNLVMETENEMAILQSKLGDLEQHKRKLLKKAVIIEIKDKK